jgi:hypothetical protein
VGVRDFIAELGAFSADIAILSHNKLRANKLFAQMERTAAFSLATLDRILAMAAGCGTGLPANLANVQYIPEPS